MSGPPMKGPYDPDAIHQRVEREAREHATDERQAWLRSGTMNAAGKRRTEYDATAPRVGLAPDVAALSIGGQAPMEDIDVGRLRAAIHDWLCDNQPHTTKRPWFGWNCERGAKRTFDILTGNVVDWNALVPPATDQRARHD